VNVLKVTLQNFISLIDSIPQSAAIFNLCDSSDERNGYPGISVAEYLDLKNRWYAGSSKEFCVFSKADLLKCQLDTPKSIKLTSRESLNPEKFAHLKYPLIVKPSKEGGSVDIEEDSKVFNYESLIKKIKEKFEIRLLDEIIVQEFIRGREFTVLVVENANNLLEPYVLEPLEVIFP